MTQPHSAPVQQPSTTPPDGVYQADPGRSRVKFKAKAFGLLWVHGELPVASGSFEITGGRLRGAGEIDAHRISTGMGVRDWHLRTSHYLHTARHPVIQVSVEDTDLASRTAVGEVTVRDTPAAVNLEIDSVEFTDGTLRVQASAAVDRTAYPMLPPLAGVSRLVHVELTVIATPESPGR